MNPSACPNVAAKENSTLPAWEQTSAKPTASRYATKRPLIAQTHKPVPIEQLAADVVVGYVLSKHFWVRSLNNEAV